MSGRWQPPQHAFHPPTALANRGEPQQPLAAQHVGCIEHAWCVCGGGSGVHVWPRESEKAREVMVLGVWGAKDWRVWQRVRG